MRSFDMKGFLSYIILWNLAKKRKNGIEISKDLEKRRGSKPSPGTLYPALKELKGKDSFKQKELDRDLENPRNRWVIKAHGAAGHDIYLPVIRGSYTLVGRWRYWELWERMGTGKRRFKPPIFSDGFEATDTLKWSAAN